MHLVVGEKKEDSIILAYNVGSKNEFIHQSIVRRSFVQCCQVQFYFGSNMLECNEELIFFCSFQSCGRINI